MKILYKEGEGDNIQVQLLNSRQDDDQLKEYFKLRKLVWVDKFGWEESTNDKEIDYFDKFSHYIILVKDEKVIGGCRVIDAKKVALPISSLRSLDCFPEADAFEISRLFIYEETVSIKVLLKGTYNFVKAEGKNKVYCVIRHSLYRALKKAGMNVLQIGDSMFHGGMQFTPVEIDIINGLGYN